jgi:hypothetical protein
MKESRLELNGMTCDSCDRLIRRVAEQSGAAIKEINIKEGYITVLSEDADLEGFRQKIAEKGYTERKEPRSERGNPERILNFMGAVIAGDPEMAVETRLFNHAIGSMAVLILLGAAAYFTFMKDMPKSQEYVPLLLLAIGGSIVTMSSYQHVIHYRKSMSCMNGMMVGMTMGMISGFLVGAVIGATNGMFIGSVAGIAIGVAGGVNLGRCCGVMGAMEGIMAGLMAGVMGAMTSIMMINDNLMAFLYILFGICTFVLGGLSYLMYREAGAAPKPAQMPTFFNFLARCTLLALMIGLIMFFGPRGPISYL